VPKSAAAAAALTDGGQISDETAAHSADAVLTFIRREQAFKRTIKGQRHLLSFKLPTVELRAKK